MTMVFVLLVVLFSLNSFTNTKSDDVLKEVSSMIEAAVVKTLDILKNKKLDKNAKREKVLEIIKPMLDVNRIAKLTLGRKNWPKLDQQQKKQFIKLFVKQLEDSYVDKIDLISNGRVEFSGAIRKKKKIHVPTTVHSKDKKYQVLYKLYSKKGSWMVFDVEIEGISLVKSYYNQFDQFLAKNTVVDLLKKIEENALGKPKELKEKEKKIEAQKEVKEDGQEKGKTG